MNAFSAIECPQSRLVIVGKPAKLSTENWLQKCATVDNRLTIHLEYAPTDLLTAHLTACDAVVLPYRNILASSAVSLATAYGRPIIAPIQGCLQEYPPQAGILYQANDNDGLVKALSSALTVDLDLLGAAAYEYSTLYPWSLVEDLTTSIYRKVLK